MKSPSAFVALLCSFALVVMPVFAQAEPPPTNTYTPVVIDLDDEQGVWLPANQAERLLDVVERELPAAIRVIKLEQERNDLLRQQVQTATTALAEERSISAANRELSDRILKAYNEEVDRNSGLFNEPAFWFGTGALAVGVAVVAGIFINQAIK